VLHWLSNQDAPATLHSASTNAPTANKGARELLTGSEDPRSRAACHLFPTAHQRAVSAGRTVRERRGVGEQWQDAARLSSGRTQDGTAAAARCLAPGQRWCGKRCGCGVRQKDRSAPPRAWRDRHRSRPASARTSAPKNCRCRRGPVRPTTR
jgi:hypothetical protein